MRGLNSYQYLPMVITIFYVPDMPLRSNVLQVWVGSNFLDARAGCNSVPFGVESITGDGCTSGSHSNLFLKLVYLQHKTKVRNIIA